jgi:uncharacterized protein (UPF0548 family)
VFAPPYRVAVIGRTGRGDYGHSLDLAVREQANLEVVAVADEDPQGRAGAAKRLGIERSYNDYRTMLERERPQFVVVAPRWLDGHKDMILACAERGVLGVFCEKPLAPDLSSLVCGSYSTWVCYRLSNHDTGLAPGGRGSTTRMLSLRKPSAAFQETPIQTVEVVAMVARAVGLWWLNACKIVYVVDESGPISKFGLDHGTLPDHAESGEERFLIEWDHADNNVWYDIPAISQPNYVLTRLGYPLVRGAQKRFGRESAAAMLKAVAADHKL